MSLNHLIYLKDCTPDDVKCLVAKARALKAGKTTLNFANKVLGMLFFNPSLRTRVSFETAMLRFGGHAVVLSPGQDMWALEYQTGTVMAQNRPEHVKDAARVLGRLCDALAIRSFASMQDFAQDMCDKTLKQFQKYATVPIISMESAIEHPCQGLADYMTMQESLGALAQKHCTITWAPHIKALPMAVPHSTLLASAHAGMHITLAHPPEFPLAQPYIQCAKSLAQSQGGSLSITHNQAQACRQADIVYAKSWGSQNHYGNNAWHSTHLKHYDNWQVHKNLCRNAQRFLHCLPVRRNLEVADDILDDPKSGIYDQAENRFWVQAAVLDEVLR